MSELADTLTTGMTGTRTVCLDSLSAIGDMCKHSIITKDKKLILSARKARGKAAGAELQYDDLMSQEEWGLYLARMKGLLAQLTSCPFHLVCTSLAAWTPDKRTGTVRKTPALQGRLALEVAQYFDLVFYMDSIPDAEGREARVWRTASDSTIEAKDASGVLEPVEETDWTQVFRKILTSPTVKET
jgi:hypothetical protein